MTTKILTGIDGLPLPSADTVFNLPHPPADSVFNLSFANTVTLIYGVGILLFLVWAMLKPGNRILPIAMIAGGACVTFLEPLFDVLTAVWHPPINQNVAFTLLGRDIPVWAFFGYMAYYGCTGYLMLQSFMKGISTRTIWLWCLVPIFFDFLIEESMLHWDLYYYYANQPFVLIKFPLYQPACNTVGVFFGVTVLYLLSPWLKQSWKWLPAAMIIIPACGGMGFVGAAIPAMFAINAASIPNWLTQLCGLASYALMFAWVYGVSLIVAVDSPYRYHANQGHVGKAHGAISGAVVA